MLHVYQRDLINLNCDLMSMTVTFTLLYLQALDDLIFCIFLTLKWL